MTVLELTGPTDRVDRITAQAREVQPARVALSVIVAVLWFIGAAAWKTVAAVWFVTAWSAVAVRQGWRDARLATETKRGTGAVDS